DPGWTPLFGLCEGIIVEHGGLLSHAAIISRELNLPCIIGLKNATKNLKDGQTITLNGFTGEVTIHD
ncbi:MAG: PEP-utilizing enzyme, partial [Candidatus Nanoarchaeia archaeon]|nr:PEP-utilizing enzyme [Candidatus Nanoarchaeia archaeon]